MAQRKLFTEWAMDIAEEMIPRSTCISRQVGAVLIKNKQIIATGYNGAPTGCLHCTDIGYCERRKRNVAKGQGLEICRAGHAESNAIDQCAKHGVSCEGATLYVTDQPCTFCAIRIIQAGIKEVVFKGEYPNNGLSPVLLQEAGVSLVKFEDAISEDGLRELKKEETNLKKVKEFESMPRRF